MIRSIDTYYKGFKFRSRLEARWAVFFDALNIAWEYEPKGFSNEGVSYLPDFYLTGIDLWVEVKGDPSGLWNDRERLKKVLVQDGPLPLLVLGDIPYLTSEAMVFHPSFLVDEKGALKRVWCTFIELDGSHYPVMQSANSQTSQHPIQSDFLFFTLLGIQIIDCVDVDSPEKAWSLDTVRISGKWSDETVMGAYQIAKEARFEHGQKGGQ